MKKALGIAGTLGLLFLCAPPASAELVAKGDLFVHFDGGISPNALPRDEKAPISVRYLPNPS